MSDAIEADKAKRRYVELQNLRALMQEDDHKCWVALGRPKDTRLRNVDLLIEAYAKVKSALDAGMDPSE